MHVHVCAFGYCMTSNNKKEWAQHRAVSSSSLCSPPLAILVHNFKSFSLRCCCCRQRRRQHCEGSRVHTQLTKENTVARVHTHTLALAQTHVIQTQSKHRRTHTHTLETDSISAASLPLPQSLPLLAWLSSRAGFAAFAFGLGPKRFG